MKPSHRRAAASLLVLGLAAPLLVSGCKLGPYPDFLEPVDKLESIEGSANGWILVEEDQTQILVLGESGNADSEEAGTYLHSTIGRDTSVLAETGSFEIDGFHISMTPEIRYELPRETGSVDSRIGAQHEELEPVETRMRADAADDYLEIEGLGRFQSMDKALETLDVSTQEGVDCFARFLQLSQRTIQGRIRNFGGSGLLIYYHNETEFVGLLDGFHAISLNSLSNPVTTQIYDDFSDFPGVYFRDAFYTDVNMSGTGEMEGTFRFAIGPDADQATDSDDLEGLDLLYHGRFSYGPEDAIQIKGGDAIGGSYGVEFDLPLEASYRVDWTILDDIDLTGCFD